MKIDTDKIIDNLIEMNADNIKYKLNIKKNKEEYILEVILKRNEKVNLLN